MPMQWSAPIDMNECLSGDVMSIAPWIRDGGVRGTSFVITPVCMLKLLRSSWVLYNNNNNNNNTHKIIIIKINE